MNIRRYSTVILLTLLALVLVPLATPVLADSPVKGRVPVAGLKVRPNEYTELTLLEVKDNRYTWNAKISPQVTLDSGAPIDPMWHFDGKKWVAGANLFTATVQGERVSMGYAGETMVWTPRLVSKESVLLIPHDKQLAPASTAPKLLPVDPWNSNYSGNTLQWDYGRGITRNVRIIEGLIQEYYTVAAPLGDDVVFDMSPVRSRGYTWERDIEAWDAEGEPVVLAVDAEYTVRLPANFKATYPITIDPDSSFVTSASDGYVRNYNSAYNYATIHDAASGTDIYKTGAASVVGQKWSTGDDSFFVYRAFLYFDTSALTAEANVTAATVNLRPYSDGSDTDFNVVVVSGMPTYPADPFAVADYHFAHYNTTSLGTLSTSGWMNAGYRTITLNAAGLAKINTTGSTKFALLSSRDISSTQPSGSESVAFYNFEQGTGYWPYLNVTYTALAAPVVSTLAASNIANTTARLNGYINSSGGELCDVRFQYGTSAGVYTVNSTWVNDTYDTGDYPYLDITSLTADTQYFFRVQAANSLGTDDGDEFNFTTSTSLLPPSSIQAMPDGTSISLTWVKGAGATNTLIRGKAGSYPTGITDGTEVYDGAANTVSHTGLTEGTTYYYVAWGESGGEYSETTAEVLATTGIATAATGVPDTPSAPSTWWTASDPTKLSELPLYDEFCDVIDGYGIARNTGWLFVFMSIIIIVVAGVFGATNGNIMVTGITAGGLFFVFSAVHLLPMWMMGMAGVIFLSMAIARERA